MDVRDVVIIELEVLIVQNESNCFVLEEVMGYWITILVQTLFSAS